MALLIVAFSTFADAHPFLAWCSLWVIWVLYALSAMALECLFKLGQRVLRFCNIAARGWPPEHLDATGDPIESRTDQLGEASVTYRGPGAHQAGDEAERET